MNDDNAIDEILGLTPAPAAAPAPVPVSEAPRRRQEEEDEPDPEDYRPYMARSPIPSFAVVEATGKRHLFAYHALKHPQYEARGGEEVLSFFGDGAYCIIGGKGLLPIFQAMQRHRLWEVRAYDGKPIIPERTRGVMIEQLEVHAAHERLAQDRAKGEEL